jgi:hypothetical protein
MPNRILREGILTSARVDSLSAGAEIFYRRLHSKVDDHGRHESHPELLRSACYPLRVDRVKARHVIAWLAECEKAGLLVVYKQGSKTYLQLLDWRQQVRSESKFPAPDAACLARATQMRAGDAHMLADAHLVVGVVVSEGVGGIASRAEARSAPEPEAIVCLIPLNDGSDYGVSKSEAEELSKLYPAVDVPQTLNEIRGWNLANQARRKTRRGIKTHINGWMSKEQNRGPQASR